MEPISAAMEASDASTSGQKFDTENRVAKVIGEPICSEPSVWVMAARWKIGIGVQSRSSGVRCRFCHICRAKLAR